MYKRFKNPGLKYGVLPLMVLSLVFLVSCPSPLEEAAARRLGDTIPPIILIEAPEDGAFYANRVEVRGRVTDYAQGGLPGRVSKVIFSVSPEIIQGTEVSLQGDGTFSFHFDSSLFNASMLVKVRAEDWNGNISEVSIPLVNAGNSIPSFSAEPGNRQVELIWDQVLYSEGYTLYNRKTGESVPVDLSESSFVWDGLVNGKTYSFQLQSHTEEGFGPDNWSSLVQLTPLSPLSLVPRLSALRGMLFVEWNPTETGGPYTVLRSQHPGGPYDTLAVTEQAWFQDRTAVPGVSYYYRVYPSGQDTVISDPSPGMTGQMSDRPMEILSVYGNGLETFDIALFGTYAYVACRRGDISVFEIGNPESPALLGSINILPGWTSFAALAVNEGAELLYASFNSRIYILDLEDPVNPVLLNEEGLNVVSLIFSLCQKDGYVYAAASNGGLAVVDARVPESPSLLQYVAYGTSTRRARHAVLAGSSILVSDSSFTTETDRGIWAFDISDQSIPPEWKGTFTDGNAGFIWTSVRESTAYSLDTQGKMHIIDFSDPSSPERELEPVVIEANISGTKAPVSIGIDGNTAYVSVFNTGLKAVSISPGTDPHVIGTVGSVNASYTLTVTDSAIFASDIYSGLVSVKPLERVSLQDSGSPVTFGHNIRDIASAGNYCYVLDENRRMHILDAWDIGAPAVASLILPAPSSSFPAFRIITHGNYVLAAVDRTIHIVDVSVPEDPEILSEITASANVTSLSVRGDYAYISTINGSLLVYDLGDPTAPRLVDNGSLYGSSMDISITGAFAYVATGSSGVNILDLSDPEKPRSVAAFNPLSPSNRVLSEAGILYSVASIYTGDDQGPYITAADLNNPKTPAELYSRKVLPDTSWGILDLKLTERYILAAAWKRNEGPPIEYIPAVLVLDRFSDPPLSVRDLIMGEGVNSILYPRLAVYGHRVFFAPGMDEIMTYDFDLTEN